jgi:hypothetical protein
VKAETAGEEPVAIGNVHLVARPSATGADRSGHQRRPKVDVAARIADHGGFSGRTARSVDANDVIQWHRKHAERIVLTKILLGGERETRKIGETLDIRRRHTGRGEFPLVMRHRQRAANRLLEPIQLERAQLIDARAFNRIGPIERRRA